MRCVPRGGGFECEPREYGYARDALRRARSAWGEGNAYGALLWLDLAAWDRERARDSRAWFRYACPRRAGSSCGRGRGLTCVGGAS